MPEQAKEPAKKPAPAKSNAPIDLSKPRWDQSTYMGRAKHFIVLTNPLNFFASDKDLDDAKNLVDEYKKTKKMPPGYDEDKLWATKYLVDSAFHPDTGEKMIKIGRMSAQAPMNTLITGCMITFYKTKPAIMFWQWFNQTFNAIVNYTNRSGDAVITTKQILASYCAACSGALTTALYLNSKVKGMNPVFARLVPFVAVGSANFINIPMMRSSELINGTPVFTPDGKRVGESKKAAGTGILLVCISRVFMAVPGMTLVPLVTNIAVQRNLFCHYPLAVIPFQLSLVCICAIFATPFCCAIFEQKANMNINALEPNLKDAALKLSPKTTTVYYNKGFELINGTPVFTPDGKRVGESKKAAGTGILLVCISRVFMAVPGMTLVPLVTNIAVQRNLFCHYPLAVIPFQLSLVCICAIFATPFCCAIFEQKANMNINALEPNLKDAALKLSPKTTTVYYNKGL